VEEEEEECRRSSFREEGEQLLSFPPFFVAAITSNGSCLEGKGLSLITFLVT